MKGNAGDSPKHCYRFLTIEINLKMRFVHLSMVRSDGLSHVLGWKEGHVPK